MKTSVAVLFAAVVLGAAAPASACDCFLNQLRDDAAPPWTPMLPLSVQAQVAYRDGAGLSQAGFYNDPSAYAGYGRRTDGPHVIEGPVLKRRY